MCHRNVAVSNLLLCFTRQITFHLLIPPFVVLHILPLLPQYATPMNELSKFICLQNFLSSDFRCLINELGHTNQDSSWENASFCDKMSQDGS